MHLGAARLLYGMGRSKVLPERFFGAIDAKHHVPRNNVILIGAIVMGGAFLLTYALGAEMINFGALIAFMGVNAAAFTRYFIRTPHHRVWNFFPPVFGFLTCVVLWWNLSQPAKVLGSCWMFLGIAYGFWRTRGFRAPISFEAPKS